MMDGDVWVEAFLKEDSRRLEMQLEQALLGGEPPDEVQFVSIPRTVRSLQQVVNLLRQRRATLVGTTLTGEMELWT
jgi:hypothetical protein